MSLLGLAMAERSKPQAGVHSMGKLADSETETDIPSSESEQAFEDVLISATASHSELPQHLRRCADMREVRSMRRADAFQPCWLAIHGQRCAIVQMAARVSLDPIHASAARIDHNSEQLGEMSQPEASASPRAGCSSESLASTRRSPCPGMSVVRRTSNSAFVTWTIAGGKLHSKDRTVVSPAFDLPMGCQVPFRLVVQAKRKSAGENFTKAKGVGDIRLKCEAPSGDVPGSARMEFCMSVGDSPWRGPASIDFARQSVVGLPPQQQFWNLRSAVDASSNTFTVHLAVEWQDEQLQGRR